MRLSVTNLESFRYFKSREDSDVETLVADLAHVSPPNRKMLAGKALASFLEHAKQDTLDSATVDGWRFDFNLDASIPSPLMREMKFEEVLQTKVGPVTLVGKCDGYEGVTVRDQKLTEKFDPEKYVDSLQWRAYLAMLGAKQFVYDIFVGDIDEREDVVTVNEYHQMVFYAYPKMWADVERAVGELAEVVTSLMPKYEVLRKWQEEQALK